MQYGLDQDNIILKKSLNKWQLLSIGIGGVIGAGIFVLVGDAAGSHAGPAVVVSFLLTAIACSCMAFCYAELASIYPTSGSAYSYALDIFGKTVSILIALLLLLEYGISSAAVAVGWSEYLIALLKDFDVHISPIWTNATGENIVINTQTEQAIFNIPAFLSMVGVTFILYQGIKETAYATTIMVLFKIFVMLLFVGIGIFYINFDNYTPFIPEYQPDTKRYGWWGIVTASHIAFFAYMGFNSVATAASEAKNPQKDIPFAILGTLLICTILYSLLAFVLTGVVHYSDLIGNNAPLALVADKIGISWFKILLKIGALVALSSVMLVSTYSMIRVMIFMANDGLFPKIFAKISHKTQIPIYNTLVLGGILALLAGLFPIDVLGDIVTCGTLFAAAIICFAVFWLHLKQPNMPRPFKTPFTPFVSLLGVIISLFLAISAGFNTLLYLGIYIVVIGGLITIYRYFY